MNPLAGKLNKIKPIQVFYHLFIPPDIRSQFFPFWIDTQLGMLVKSGLATSAKINMCITMPVYWDSVNNQKFIRYDSPDRILTVNEVNEPTVKIPNYSEMCFRDKVIEYISLRYPFVNILNVRDTSEINIFEGQTLHFLHKQCIEQDCYVLYLHSKGFTSFTLEVHNWFDILNHFCINEWRKCVEPLQDNDIVGVKDLVSDNNVMSGNFWWSKSSHIKNLPDPLENFNGHRYDFERWCMKNNPKIHHIFDTKTDHFSSYCFLDNLVNNI